MRTITFAVTVCLALGAGVALAQERSSGEFIDDSTIVANTKLDLLEDAAVKGTDINVEGYKGEVQLIGFVDSSEAKSAAIARAESVKGVTKVNDALVVMSGERSMGRAIDDQTLKLKVKAAVADVAGIGEAASVIVEVREGELLLGGYVDEEKDRNDVMSAVEGVEGIAKIHNRIGTKM